ncbi:molybdate ABC transporter substrate-binding protein [Pinisolibacter sp.]|uniref:molybdate ABC transporter substrate-binding protein n=1 Tax=Pinisolibacter sp. TaxID=2172024 RepID=UPI002FDDF68A
MFQERRSVVALYGMLVGAMLLGIPQSTRAAEIQVAVAANFTAPMQKIAAEFEAETGHKAVLAFGTVGKFYSQMKAGAPFEVLVSSDRETPDALVRDGLAIGETRFTYAIGKLTLWSATPGVVDDKGEVLRTGSYRHLALANPKLAVYGAAGQVVMKKLGVWEAIEPKLVTAENISQAYQFVASGNAELGFVAFSQIVGPDGKVANGSTWMVPADLYPQLAQDVILLAPGKDSAAAKDLVDHLRSDKARAIIRSYGYDLPN